MSEWRVAFAGETPEEPLEWRLVSGSGEIRGRGAGSIDVFARTGADKTALILPGMQIACFTAALAARNERQARAAAPFAIEDDVAEDVEMLHIALLNPAAEPQPGMRTLFAADKALIAGWTNAFSTLGLKLSLLAPDYMCLPATDETLSVAFLDRRALVRAAQWGAAVDAAFGQTVLDPILEAKSAGRTVDVVGVAPGAAPWPGALAAAPGDPADAFDVLARGAVSGGAANLLQGPFAPKGERIGVDHRKWTSAIAAAAAALVLTTGANIYEGMSLNRNANAVKAETGALFQDAFPEVGRVVNPRAQLRAMSASGNAGEPDFLVLSSYLAAGLQSAEGVSIDSVRFDSARQELSASVLFTSYDALAEFRAAIEAAGGRVEEGGSRQAGDRRSGELKVRRS